MPITEAQLLEKEAALKKVQTRLDGLLNDDIPDEEQPQILELKEKIAKGLMALEELKKKLQDPPINSVSQTLKMLRSELKSFKEELIEITQKIEVIA